MRISDWSSDVCSSDLLTAYLGPPGGYVVEFTNGLTVYLSGDTGHTAEQDSVVRRRFGAELVVMNIGGIFSTGPTEAAFVINELVKPARSEEHTSELQSLMRISYAVFCLKKKTTKKEPQRHSKLHITHNNSTHTHNKNKLY